MGIAVLIQNCQQTVFKLQVGIYVVGGVLGFRVHANHAAYLGTFRFGHVHHLAQGWNLVLAIEGLVAAGGGLLGAQGFDFGQREIGGEPAGFVNAIYFTGDFAAGELGTVSHIRGAGDIGLVSRDQFAIFGGNQVWLDEIRAHLDGQFVALNRVLGQVARRTTMARNQGHRAVKRHQRLGAAGATAGDQAGDTNRCHCQCIVARARSDLW